MKINKYALTAAGFLVFSSHVDVRAESQPAAAPAAPAETAAAPAQPAATVELLRTVLTKVVENRDPVGEITTAGVGDVVIGWTQVRSEGGESTITHRWMHEGANMGDVPLTIRSSPWRTWSRKTIHAPGNWTWQVLSPDGSVLKETAFTVSAAASAPAAAPTPAAPATSTGAQ